MNKRHCEIEHDCRLPFKYLSKKEGEQLQFWNGLC